MLLGQSGGASSLDRSASSAGRSEGHVARSSVERLAEQRRETCLVMFLDGTGGPRSSDPVLSEMRLKRRRVLWFFDVTAVLAPKLGFWKDGMLSRSTSSDTTLRNPCGDPSAR